MKINLFIRPSLRDYSWHTGIGRAEAKIHGVRIATQVCKMPGFKMARKGWRHNDIYHGC